MIHLNKYITKYDNIIWDWNGTLLDDIDVSYKVISNQLQQYNLDVPSLNDIRKLFCFPIKKYYQKLGFPDDIKTFNKLTQDFFKQYKKAENKISLFYKCEELLLLLNKQRKNQFILSASEENYLKGFVAKLNISNYFSATYGLKNLHADSKISRGEDLLSDFSIDKSKTVLIGDTNHDIEVANSLGIKIIVLEDGHQNLSTNITKNFLCLTR